MAASQSSDRNLRARGDSIYFRMVVVTPEGPKEINQSLGRIDWATARKVRDALVRTLEGAALCARMGMDYETAPLAEHYDVESMLRRLNLLKRRGTLATIGQILQAFETDAMGRNISTDTGSSGYKATTSLKLIIRTARPDVEEVEKLPATVLTEQLLEDYQAAKIASVNGKGPDEVASTRRTLASTVNQARMVVSERACAQSEMRKLILPDLEGFRSWKPESNPRRLRIAIDDATVARLRHEIDELWFKSPGHWVAAVLCGNLGLRRGSAKMARWSWARQVGGNWMLYVLDTDEASPKGNEYSVEIDPSLWKDLCAVRSTGDYFVPGATVEERDQYFTDNVVRLRGLGLDVDKPNHELRALFAQAMDRTHGRAAASAALGHSELATTQIYTGRALAGGSVRPL
jgi:integrase